MKNEIMDRGFDFSIRIIELVDFLKREGKDFPLSQRLMLCGEGLGSSLRLRSVCAGKEKSAVTGQALAYAVECGYLLDLMVKTGYLTEIQSKPIREECQEIRDWILSQ